MLKNFCYEKAFDQQFVFDKNWPYYMHKKCVNKLNRAVASGKKVELSVNRATSCIDMPPDDMISRRKLSQHLSSPDRDEYHCDICSLDSVKRLASSLEKTRPIPAPVNIPEKSYPLRKISESGSLPEYKLEDRKPSGPKLGRRSTETYDKSSKLKPLKPPTEKKCQRCFGTIHHGVPHICDIRKTMNDAFNDFQSRGVADKMASKCLQPYWNKDTAEIRGGNNRKFIIQKNVKTAIKLTEKEQVDAALSDSISHNISISSIKRSLRSKRDLVGKSNAVATYKVLDAQRNLVKDHIAESYFFHELSEKNLKSLGQEYVDSVLINPDNGCTA